MGWSRPPNRFGANAGSSRLRPDEFQTYGGGIYEGQVLTAKMAGTSPPVCPDPMLTRVDMALRVPRAPPELPREVMALSARVVVLTLLMRQHGCPARQQQVAPRSHRGE